MTQVEKLTSKDENLSSSNKTNSFPDQSKTYVASGIKASLHGTMYQFKLLLLFLKRGLSHEYAFLLATEMEEAEKFDDLVLKYKDSHGNTVCRFLQAKHKQDESKKIIYSDLITSAKMHNGFSLEKYYISYYKIKNSNKFSGNELKDFILYTNINFDLDDLKSNGVKIEEIKEPDDFLQFKDIQKSPMRYKLHGDKLKNNLMKKLKSSKLLPVLDDKTLAKEMDEFFDKLVFAVNQPNESELGKIIAKEIGEEFNLLDSDFLTNDLQKNILDWVKAKEGTYLSKENIEIFLNQGKEKISKLILIGPTSEYCKKLQQSQVEFKTILTDLNDFLKDDSRQILNLVSSQSTKLIAIKTIQTLSSMKNYQQGDSFIFIHSSSFLCLKEDVLSAFKSSNSNNLLIIECKTNVTAATVQPILEILRMTTSKKLILLTDIEFEIDPKYEEKFERKFNSVAFSDLTEESQAHHLAKKVLFQGEEIVFNELIDEDSKNLIDSETLVKLINEEKIEIGCELTISSEYDLDYYISRKFCRQIEISTKIFDTNLHATLLVIDGVDKATLVELGVKANQVGLFDDGFIKYNRKKILLNNQNLAIQEWQFMKLCKKYKNHKIHWLTHEFEKFIWNKSRGSISDLLPYVKIDQTVKNDNSSEESLFHRNSSEEKVVILSDTAGMGKSTVLSHLSQKIKETNQALWIVRMNLSNFSKFLYENLHSNINNDNAIEFLVNKLLESELKTSFEKELFKNSLDKVVLMFDGVDEVSQYQEPLIKLLQALQNTSIQKLWLTTRSTLKQKLEENLGVFAYSLKPFSEDDQLEFLLNYWKKKLNLTNLLKEDKLKKYAKTIITQFSTSIGDQMKEFIGIPLQIKMLAEIFQENSKEWQGLKEFLNDSNDVQEPKLPEKLDLYNLYELFAKKKLQFIHLREKLGLDFTKQVDDLLERCYKDSKKMYGLLALRTLLNDDDLTELLSIKENLKDNLHLWLTEIKQGERNQGIINDIINDKPRFVHLTFAEFFAACYLAKKIFSHPSTVFKIINNIITNTSPVFLYCITKPFKKGSKFLDGRTLLNYVTQEGYINCVKVLLGTDYENYPEADKLNKASLHYAAEFGQLEIVQYLVKFYDDIRVDDILEYEGFKHEAYANSKLVEFVNKQDNDDHTAIYYAAKNKNMKIACELLLKGADAKKLKEYINTLTLYVTGITNLAKLNDHRYRPIAEKLLLLAPEAVSDKEVIYEFPRLLSYFFLHGRIRVIRTVLNQVDENKRKLILNEGDKKFFPLDQVNCSDLMNDDERLEITKYILENGGRRTQNNPDWKSNDDHIAAILQAAAEHDHIKTLKYFISHANPGSYTKLVNYACIYNQYNIIQFLVDNYTKEMRNEGLRTPLHFASFFDTNLKIIKNLLADINSKNEEGETPLLVAIRADHLNLNLIKYLIQHGADFNTQDYSGKTPLDSAIEKELEYDVYHNKYYHNIIHFLLENGASMNTTSELIQHFLRNPEKYDQYGLHLAILRYDRDLCKLILRQRKGIDINTRTKNKTPLQLAIELLQSETVELLLQYGAKYDIIDANNRTPLDILNQYGSTYREKIYWLLNALDKLFHSQNLMHDLNEHFLKEDSGYKANWGPYGFGSPDAYDSGNPIIFIFNARNAQNKTLIHIAAETNDKEALDTILQFNKLYLRKKNDKRYSCKDYQPILIDAVDIQGNTPLHIASKNGHCIVSTLLNLGVIYKAKNNLGKTPEMLAKENHHENIVALLKPINDLFDAIKSGDFENVEKYTTEGVYIHLNIKDKDGRTPLHHASGTGQLKIIKCLLQHGANLEIGDKDNCTPLNLAAKNNKIGAVELLLKHGAIFNSKILAELDGVDEKIKILLTTINKLFNMIESDHPEIVIDYIESIRETVKISIIINARDIHGNTLLHYAAKRGYFAILKYLLEYGAIYNIPNNRTLFIIKGGSETPIYLANHKNIKDLLSLIENIFSNINTLLYDKEINIKLITNVRQNPGNKTLLHEATLLGELEVVKWLVENGSNVNAKDINEKTPLVIAIEQGHTPIIEYLRSFENEEA